MSARESVSEFLMRGGRIKQCKPGSKKTTTNRELIKRDRVIRELKKLKSIAKTQREIDRIDAEIQRRIDILK